MLYSYGPDGSDDSLPAMWETWVCYLGQEDPLEKGMASPIFLPGESHGQRSLVGHSPWGHKESDMTEQLRLTYMLYNRSLLVIY